MKDGKVISHTQVNNGSTRNSLVVQRERSFPGGAEVKNPLADAGDTGDVCSIPGWGRPFGEANDNLLQYSCLDNPMDRGAWQATDHGTTKCWT